MLAFQRCHVDGSVTVPTPGSWNTSCRGCVLSVLRRQRYSFRTLEMFSEISLPVPSQQMTRFFGAGLPGSDLLGSDLLDSVLLDSVLLDSVLLGSGLPGSGLLGSGLPGSLL